MGRKTGAGFRGRVGDLRRAIARWRRVRGRGSAMPGQLWEEAVRLARAEGTYVVARALGVDYGSLARRVAAARGAGESKRSASAFVPLGGGPFFGAAPSGPELEMSDGTGVRLVIRLGGGAEFDVAALVQGFRAHRA